MAMAYDDNRSYTEPATDYEKTTPELTPDHLLIRIKEWWRIDYPGAKKWHKEARLAFVSARASSGPPKTRNILKTPKSAPASCSTSWTPSLMS